MKRVCVLTGASGLLGNAFIRKFREDYEIIAIHHRHALAVPTQDDLSVDPINPRAKQSPVQNAIFALRADITKDEVVRNIVRSIINRFGRIDILVNAAAYRCWLPLLEARDRSNIEFEFRVNTIAPICLAVEIAHQFWRFCVNDNLLNNRNVVNVSSTAGLYVYPDLGQTWYSASKAALNIAGYHLASEFWDLGVRVNTIAPNSFPSHVSTAEVLTKIVEFDRSSETGQLAVLNGRVQ